MKTQKVRRHIASIRWIGIFGIFLLARHQRSSVTAVCGASVSAEKWAPQQTSDGKDSKISAATGLSSWLVNIQGHLHSVALSLHQTRRYDSFSVYPSLFLVEALIVEISLRAIFTLCVWGKTIFCWICLKYIVRLQVLAVGAQIYTCSWSTKQPARLFIYMYDCPSLIQIYVCW